MPPPTLMKYLLLLFFLLLYLLLPTQNSTVDAYFYAGGVKYSEYLFLPHHLVYNALGWLWINFFRLIGMQTEVLPLLKAMNATAATASLFVLYKILQQLELQEKQALAWVTLTGCSFGLWRFATENETYVLPLLFSLAGSYFFIVFSKNSQKTAFLILSGLMAALACLFHQIHVFWWLGLFVGSFFFRKKVTDVILFAFPAVIIPLVYALVLFFDQNQEISLKNLLGFVLHDVQAGRVQTQISLQNFILTPINLVRTWLQVHGNMLYLLKKSWLFALPALLSAGLFFYVISRKRFINALPAQHKKQFIFWVHLLIFLLQLAFAFYSVGNAEFMVMLPPLLALLLGCLFYFDVKAIAAAALALFTWNISYGIFPNYYFQYSHQQEVMEHLQQHPNALFISSDDAQLLNELYYQTGREENRNVVKSPSLMALKQLQLDSLHTLINSYRQNGKKVFTDCLQKPKVQNRASMVIADVDSVFFASYSALPTDTFATFYGHRYLFEIRKK